MIHLLTYGGWLDLNLGHRPMFESFLHTLVVSVVPFLMARTFTKETPRSFFFHSKPDGTS
jgi:hypothetical protein